MSSRRIRIATGLLACVVLALARTVHAGDTLELFDPGVSDFELYFGYGGAGKGEPERSAAVETLIGIGITDRLSGYASASGEFNERFGEGAGALGFGIFSTPVDTDHFDLDIGFDVTVGNLGGGSSGPVGHSGAEPSFTPFVELNLDSDPEMSGYGIYAYIEHTLDGEQRPLFDHMGRALGDFTLSQRTGLTVGAYCTMLHGHQAFLNHHMSFNHTPEDGERTVEIGGVALGYNFFVKADVLEIITEVNFGIPQDGEDFGVDFLLGIIATLPSDGG